MKQKKEVLELRIKDVENVTVKLMDDNFKEIGRYSLRTLSKKMW